MPYRQRSPDAAPDGARGTDMDPDLLMTALCLALIIKILNQL
jgi:hypothetical protein